MNCRSNISTLALLVVAIFVLAACSGNNDSGGNGSIGVGGNGSDDHIICTQVIAIMYPDENNGSCKLAGNGCQISDLEARGYTALYEIAKCSEHCSDTDCQSFQR